MRPIDTEKYILATTQLETGQREVSAVKVGEMLCELVKCPENIPIDINRTAIILSGKGYTRIYHLDKEVSENVNRVNSRLARMR